MNKEEFYRFVCDCCGYEDLTDSEVVEIGSIIVLSLEQCGDHPNIILAKGL